MEKIHPPRHLLELGRRVVVVQVVVVQQLVNIGYIFDFIFLAKHLGEKNFKCEKCDMAFACNSLRYHHIQKVHDGIEFRCHLCGKDFAYKKGLRRHIKNVHDGAQLLDARRRLHHSQNPTYNNSPTPTS